MKHEIRYCKADEIGKLVCFINNHWKKNHIFVQSPDLLKWQYYDVKNNRFNFVVAVNGEDGLFDGVLGFIPVSHFDEKLETRDLWLAIWKVNDLRSEPGMGIDMFYFLKKEYKPSSISAIGISDIAKKIYITLGYKVGRLNHYFIINNSIKEFYIIDNTDINCIYLNNINYNKSNSNCKLEEIINTNEIDSVKSKFIPYKSSSYIKNRYLKHPIYKYKLYGVWQDKNLLCAFVTKKIDVNNSSCIRIVDVFGELEYIDNIYYQVQDILIEENAEYIDFMNYGVDEAVINRIGFNKKDESLIIPNFFEPFVRENVSLDFAFKSKANDYVIFKGDSDQDRPNQINKEI